MPEEQVFISYSHMDAKWLKDLEIHLKPYLREGSLISWSDEQIVAGSQWLREIKSALAQTKVAVLLVTPDFLASDFIHEHEAGPLLKEAEQGGVRILWVPVRESAYKQTALKNYQAVLDPKKPLATWPKAKRDEAWLKICEEIEKAVHISREHFPADSSKDAAPHSAPGIIVPSVTYGRSPPRELAHTPFSNKSSESTGTNLRDTLEGSDPARRSNVEPDHAMSNTSIETVLDSIQKAEASWREARKAYVSLKPNAGNLQNRIDALYGWNNAAKEYFSKRADAFFTKRSPIAHNWSETYAEGVLSELADHHEAIGL
jgi:hypothetical protein